MKSDLNSKLPSPFFVLAPMDDVTDTVFRQIVASTAAPDMYFTEFVNVDGLQSPGRPKLLPKLMMGPNEGIARLLQLDGERGDNEERTSHTDGMVSESRKPTTKHSARSFDSMLGSAEQQVVTVRKPGLIFAQLWGKTPENYYKSAQDIVRMGFDGVDINMGCPAKPIIQNGCCSALINNRGLTGEILHAVREGVDSITPGFPVSVKTRLGFKDVDLTWHEYLLQHKLNMLTVHGRTTAQMSKTEADWDKIGEIAKIRTSLSPQTLIVGNGDVMTRTQGIELAQKHGLDGIMIGRGIFHDPYVFAKESPWGRMTKQQKIDLYTSHVKLFAKTWDNGERQLHTLNKFCKVYIEGFPGAKDLREKLMNAQSISDLLEMLASAHVVF